MSKHESKVNSHPNFFQMCLKLYELSQNVTLDYVNFL